MARFELQALLDQLSDLTPTELCEVKTTVNALLERQLKALGVKGDLTEEEWERLEAGDVLSCVKRVRERTGLGLVDSKAYVDRARAKRMRPLPHTPSSAPCNSADNGACAQRDNGPTERGEVKTSVNAQLDNLTEEEWALLESNAIVHCIKMVRARTGLGISESKACVDRARAKGRDALYRPLGISTTLVAWVPAGVHDLKPDIPVSDRADHVRFPTVRAAIERSSVAPSKRCPWCGG